MARACSHCDGNRGSQHAASFVRNKCTAFNHKCIHNAHPSQAALLAAKPHVTIAPQVCGARMWAFAPTLQCSWSSPTALASLQGVHMCITRSNTHKTPLPGMSLQLPNRLVWFAFVDTFHKLAHPADSPLGPSELCLHPCLLKQLLQLAGLVLRHCVCNTCSPSPYLST